MQSTAKLTAANKARVEISGRHFLVLDTGAADSIEVWIYNASQELEYIRTAKRGFKARVPDGFTHLVVQSGVDATCEFVISNGVVDFDFITGTSVSATIAGPLPVPVANDRGAPGNPVNVVGVTVNDAPATALNNLAAVACGPAAVVVKAANVNSRRVRFRNLGPDAVAIGGAGITWAKRCIVLEVDETWVEDNAGNLAWSAITDAAKAASVTVQEVVN